MPARIGFARHRRQALEKELERITQMIPQLGVRQAILIGDLATDDVKPESSLDLVMVLDIPGNFTRRMDFFTSHLGPMLATNFLVYTPEEFETLKDTSSFLRNALRRGRQVYES
jgi:hypothetical protein